MITSNVKIESREEYVPMSPKDLAKDPGLYISKEGYYILSVGKEEFNTQLFISGKSEIEKYSEENDAIKVKRINGTITISCS